jgi:hypothetical protein
MHHCSFSASFRGTKLSLLALSAQGETTEAVACKIEHILSLCSFELPETIT